MQILWQFWMDLNQKLKILDNVYENKSEYSLFDAISALILLNKQDVNTQKNKKYNL